MKIELCKYWKGCKSAFSFTFDDGCYLDSSKKVVKILEDVSEKTDLCIKATVGITIGFMNDELVDFWRKATRDGFFDIASHSIGHDLSFTESTPIEKRGNDAEKSQKTLQEMFKGQSVSTYILPGGTYDSEGLLPLKEHYIAVRGNKDGINYTGNINWLDVKCFTAMLKRPYSDYTDYIDRVIETEGWGVQMNHWLTEKKEDVFHSQSLDTFEKECYYLAKKAKKYDVWVDSFEGVAKYLRKYEASELKITEESGLYTAKIVGEGARDRDTLLTLCIHTDKKVTLYVNGKASATLLPQKYKKVYVPISTNVCFSVEE